MRRRPILPLLLASMVIAAACSGDGGGPPTGDLAAADETGTEPIEGEDGDVAGVTVEEAGAIDPPTTIEELEAEWAAARQVVIDRINEAGWGINGDNVLVGPAGFQIDLNQCPEGWNNRAGIGEAIVVGETIAQSGDLASFSRIGTGMEVYFDYVNETHGGIDGLPIELVVEDDGYVAARTVEAVDSLLQIEDPLFVTTLGVPTTLAVYGSLNEQCVPHPFVMTGHPAWGDPIGHPWTTGLPMSYSTEAALWGSWIEQNLAEELPVSVAGLVMDNNFGRVYQDSFTAWADANPDVIDEFIAVRHDPSARVLDSEMNTIAASSPDVFIAMTAEEPCLLAVGQADELGLTDSALALFVPSVCKDPSVYMAPAGEAADGFYVVGGGMRATNDPEYAEDPFVAFVNAELEEAGFNTVVGFYGAGFAQYGWAHVEAMRIAAELDGGLNRTNLILAQRAMDLEHPLALDGIAFSVNGTEDAFFVEGSEISRYDAANESWVQQGATYDVNGLSPNCSWGDDGC